jgi:hypothetical protein
MLNRTAPQEFTQFVPHAPWTPSAGFLGAVSSLLLILSTSYVYSAYSGNDPKKVHRIGGLSIINAWAFFNKRYDFLRTNFDKTGLHLFSFKVLQVGFIPVQLLVS